jgi:surface antigen
VTEIEAQIVSLPSALQYQHRHHYRLLPHLIKLCALTSCLLMAGCASIQLPSFISHDDVTGSIPKFSSPLSRSLDKEDWRRAQASLGVALDPQGNGLAVSWDNPQSGAKGSFIPTAPATLANDRLCRPFKAELGGTLARENLEGLGCRDKVGEWSITQLRPAKLI